AEGTGPGTDRVAPWRAHRGPAREGLRSLRHHPGPAPPDGSRAPGRSRRNAVEGPFLRCQTPSVCLVRSRTSWVRRTKAPSTVDGLDRVRGSGRSTVKL